MIRHIQHVSTAHLPQRLSTRSAVKTEAGASPFSGVLKTASQSTASQPAASPSTALPAKAVQSTAPLIKSTASHTAVRTNPFSPSDATTPPNANTITGTVTKAAPPTVALDPPHYEQGATVTNPDGSTTDLNWEELATSGTADQIAAKLGGTVAESYPDGFSVSQRNIKVPGSPNLINAGLAAKLFAQYGDQPGSIAWQTINHDLGRDPMST